MVFKVNGLLLITDYFFTTAGKQRWPAGGRGSPDSIWRGVLPYLRCGLTRVRGSTEFRV